MMRTVLQVSDLKKSYGGTVAVKGVSFGVKRGEIVGLLGPNGAGKTTVINMVLGVLEPDGGNILIEETNLASDRSGALSHTNFAAVYAPLPGNLTVEENLRVFSLLYGVSDAKERIKAVTEQFSLTRFLHTKCGLLSSGEQTRVGIAKAFLNTPALLLLDEPTASLDPATAREVRSLVRQSAKDRMGVLWTSHNMLEVQEVCDRVLFMSKGRILLEGDPRTLPQEHGRQTLEDLFITVAREPLTLEGIHAV